MPIATPDLVAASVVLDPTGKALLNLWLHRDLSDERIAELIFATPDRVAERRARLLEALAHELDTSPDEVRRAIRWAAGDIAKPQPERVAEPERDPARALAPESGAPATRPSGAVSPVSRRRRGAVALALLAVGSTIALLAWLAGANAGRGTAPEAARKPPAEPRATGAPRSPTRPVTLLRATLKPLAGAPATGRGDVAIVRTAGRVFVRLRVTGMPKPQGTYRLWAYNSGQDARALGDVSASGRLGAPLPRLRRNYRYLDVSLQPPGTRAHSGQSVLRMTRARPRGGAFKKRSSALPTAWTGRPAQHEGTEIR
ncbi:MAG: anti-sigma factor [Solirubrobacteraceae bacterium]